MARRNIVIYHDEITPNLLVFPSLLFAQLMVECEEQAPETESWMKANAPWEDRTGNARDALWAEAFGTPAAVGIDVGHGEDIEYGAYLETVSNGRYGIIKSTVKDQGRALMRRTNGLFDRMPSVKHGGSPGLY